MKKNLLLFILLFFMSCSAEPMQVTRAQVKYFLASDTVNNNRWTENYKCVQFTRDLYLAAGAAGFDAYPVIIVFESGKSHMILAIETDEGTVWVEPSMDDFYPRPLVGYRLCIIGKLCSSTKIKKVIENRGITPNFFNAYQ